jgi:hypothetical protein
MFKAFFKKIIFKAKFIYLFIFNFCKLCYWIVVRIYMALLVFHEDQIILNQYLLEYVTNW